MRLLKTILIGLAAFCLMLTAVGCPNGVGDGSTNSGGSVAIDTSMAAPTNVTVSEYMGTQNAVAVTWAKTGDDLYYFVFYSKSNDPSGATLAKQYGMDYGTQSNGYPVILSESGTYYFWVVAADSQRYSQATKQSEFSSSASIQFTYVALAAPTDVNVAEANITNTVTVSWKSSITASVYWVYVGTDNDSSKAAILGTGSVESMSCNIALTSGNGTYYFWVRADSEPEYIMSDEGYPIGYKPSANAGTFSEAKSYNYTKWQKVAAPNQVAAQSIGNNKVAITWKGDSNMCYYVYKGTSNNSSSAELVTSTSGKNNSSSDGMIKTSVSLTASGTYYFWVRADNIVTDITDMAGQNIKVSPNASDFSQSVSVVFTYKKLEPPTQIAAIQNGKTAVKVMWAGTGADYYWVYYSKTNNSSTAKLATKDSYHSYEYYSVDNKVYYENVSLTESGKYYFWVRSDSDYESYYDNAKGYTIYNPSNQVSDFSTLDVSCDFVYTPLPVPTNVKVEKDTGNKVKVKWDATSDVNYYWVYYGKTNDSSKATCAIRYASSWTAENGYSITLTESGTWYFWVKSADGENKNSNTSAFSETESYSFTYTPLTAVTGVTATQISSKKVKVSWTPNGASYYGIYVNTTNDLSTATYKSYDTGSYETITFSKDGTYYIWVGATDDRDLFYGSSTNGIVFSTSVSIAYKYAPMAVPTNIKVNYNNESSVSLSWASTGAPYYWIYMGTSDNTVDAIYMDNYYGDSYSVGETVSSYGFSLNKGYGTYYFWVKAADAYEPDDYSYNDNGERIPPEQSDFSDSVSYEYREWKADDVDCIILYNQAVEQIGIYKLTDGHTYTFDMSDATSDVTLLFAFASSDNTNLLWKSSNSYIQLGQSYSAYKSSSYYPYVFRFEHGNVYNINWWASSDNDQLGNVILLQTYKVHFECGVAPAIADVTTDGTPITKPNNYIVGDVYTFSGKKYKFGGWVYQYAENDYREYDFTSYVNEDITLYAIWTPKVTVTFDMNGHGEQLNSQEIWSGNYVNIPYTYEKGYDYKFDGDYYRFGGWYSDSELDDEYLSDYIYTDTVLYAKWTYIAYHEVTYIDSTRNYNQSYSFAYDDTAWNVYSGEFDVGEDYEIDDTMYTFGGWYTENTFENRYLFDEAVTENITLYAKWTEVQ